MGMYWEKIAELNKRQEEKGQGKYGVALEANTTLSREQRIEHLQEELIDALKYCEHLKVIDDSLTANDYQRLSLRTAGENKGLWLDNAIMGLCGEVGECADLVKKHHFQGHILDQEKLIDELGDVLWYCALLASALEISLESVMQRNIDKLKKRYPDGFDKAASINRKE
jgi:NTP pyrophosphatase (non-canonical NTP hydrolase)